MLKIFRSAFQPLKLDGAEVAINPLHVVTVSIIGGYTVIKVTNGNHFSVAETFAEVVEKLVI